MQSELQIARFLSTVQRVCPTQHLVGLEKDRDKPLIVEPKSDRAPQLAGEALIVDHHGSDWTRCPIGITATALALHHLLEGTQNNSLPGPFHAEQHTPDDPDSKFACMLYGLLKTGVPLPQIIQFATNPSILRRLFQNEFLVRITDKRMRPHKHQKEHEIEAVPYYAELWLPKSAHDGLPILRVQVPSSSIPSKSSVDGLFGFMHKIVSRFQKKDINNGLISFLTTGATELYKHEHAKTDRQKKKRGNNPMSVLGIFHPGLVFDGDVVDLMSNILFENHSAIAGILLDNLLTETTQKPYSRNGLLAWTSNKSTRDDRQEHMNEIFDRLVSHLNYGRKSSVTG